MQNWQQTKGIIEHMNPNLKNNIDLVLYIGISDQILGKFSHLYHSALDPEAPQRKSAMNRDFWYGLGNNTTTVL